MVWTTKKTSTDMKQRVLQDPAASFWLQQRIVELDNRDVVDALHDVVYLTRFLKTKFEEITCRNNE